MKTIYNLYFNSSPNAVVQHRKIVYSSVVVETPDQATAAKLILQHIDRLETAIVAKEFANKGDFYITYEKAEKEIVEEFKISALCDYGQSIGTAEFSIYVKTPIEKMERTDAEVLAQVREELMDVEIDCDMVVSKIIKSQTHIQALNDSKWPQTFEVPTSYFELPGRVIEPLKFRGFPVITMEIRIKQGDSVVPMIKRQLLLSPAIYDYRLANHIASAIVKNYEDGGKRVTNVAVALPWKKNQVTLKYLDFDQKLVSSPDEILRRFQE